MPIQHAKAYPFFIPDTSYVVDQNGWHSARNLVRPENLHGVIASGSNASPDRLMAKFKDHLNLLDTPIFVTKAVLHDFDSVYSAHFTRYGSIPATLAPASGANTAVFVTWLNDPQLARMHETENVGVNYDYVELSDIKLVLDSGDIINAACAYLSRRGILLSQNDLPIALTSMSQEQVLTYAKSIVAPNQDSLNTFISTIIEDSCARERYTQLLAQNP